MSIQDLADEQDLVSAYKEYNQLIDTFKHSVLMVDGAIIKLTSQPGYEKNASDETMKRVQLYKEIVAECQKRLQEDLPIKQEEQYI